MCGWTRDLLDAADRRYEQRFSAQEAALIKAEKALEARLASVNEFRAALNDVVSTGMPRAEYAARHEQLVAQINDLKARIDSDTGRRGGISSSWVTLVAVVGAVGSLLAIILAVDALIGG